MDAPAPRFILEVTHAVRSASTGISKEQLMRTDGELQREIWRHLLEEPATAGTDIYVAVDRGHVALSGTVSSSLRRRLAENAVECVIGSPPGIGDLHVKVR
jgi:osmotically-inducible protein OsmY